MSSDSDEVVKKAAEEEGGDEAEANADKGEAEAKSEPAADEPEAKAEAKDDEPEAKVDEVHGAKAQAAEEPEPAKEEAADDEPAAHDAAASHASDAHGDEPEVEDDRPHNGVISIAIVTTLAAVVLSVLGVREVFRSVFQAEVDEKVLSHQISELRDLRAEETGKLGRYRWVSKKEGVVRIPVDRAVALTIAEYKERAKQAAAAPKPAPTAADTAKPEGAEPPKGDEKKAEPAKDVPHGDVQQPDPHKDH